MSDSENYVAELYQDRAEARKRAFEAEHKAQQLQAELDSLKAAHAWIKTSERMPPVEPGSDMDVLAVVAVYNSGRFVENVTMVLNYCPGYPEENDQWPWTGECCGVYGNDEVTHWQPLPEPPLSGHMSSAPDLLWGG